MRSQKLYLSDIVDSIQKILEYTKGIDYSIVWNTIELLPNLLKEMKKVKQDIEENESIIPSSQNKFK